MISIAVLLIVACIGFYVFNNTHTTNNKLNENEDYMVEINKRVDNLVKKTKDTMDVQKSSMDRSRDLEDEIYDSLDVLNAKLKSRTSIDPNMLNMIVSRLKCHQNILEEIKEEYNKKSENINFTVPGEQLPQFDEVEPDMDYEYQEPVQKRVQRTEKREQYSGNKRRSRHDTN